MCDEPVRAPGSTAAVVPVDLDAFRGERIPLEPVERVSITTLVDNVCDVLAGDVGPAHRPPVWLWPQRPVSTVEDRAVIDGPRAEHGFSVFVEVELTGGDVHRLIFDTGVTPDGMVDNMRRLGLSAGDAEVVVCSHGHFDHTMGLGGLAEQLGRANLPVILHPEFWSQRRLAIPGRDPYQLPTTSRRALEDTGFVIVEHEQPSFLFENSVLITGEVPRTTDFEVGFPIHQALRGGSWEPDPLILDDQALVVHVRDRGLVVVTGCGHAGIVNITRYARQLTGVESVHAVLGGFHLTGALFEPIIGPTLDALAELRPDVVVPAHCTGWRAQHGLAHRLPDAFIQNTVGTRFDLVA